MVILLYVIKTIQNGLLCFFLKKEQKPVSFQKNPKNPNLKKTGGLEFFEKNEFLNLDHL